MYSRSLEWWGQGGWRCGGFGDLVLIDDPFQRAAVAEAMVECFGWDAGESAGGNATIVFVHDKVRQALSELRRRFEALYGERLVRMILYGSQARGDARPWSDIDVLVVLKEPVDNYQETMRTEVTVGDLCLQFDVVVICIFMSEAQCLAGEGPLLRNISAEGVPL